MKLLPFLLFLFLSVSGFCQTDVEKARTMKDKAVEMMDNGNPDGAIKLLEEAKKLDPKSYRYDYEIAYAHYIKEDIKTALKIYKEVIKYDDANDQCFQMLGNLYDMNGEPDQALKAYDKGLKQFPGSGRLYLEKGNVFWNQKKYEEALPYYEAGIEKDPSYPSNYYRATLLYLSGSTEQVWGMLYGELFMNLERNSKRTSEISKMLFDTYKSQIKFKSDTAIVTFSKDNFIQLTDIKSPTGFRLPFGIGAYEPALLVSLSSEKAIDINSLDSIRRRFVDNYYAMKFDEKYPNVLFDYQKKVKTAGFLPAYNHWILMKGDEEAFNKWKGENEELWSDFLAWFTENGIRLNDWEKFYRKQYSDQKGK